MPSEGEFAGRVALVTGAAGAAIGSTTCRTLASHGAGIVALDSHHRRTHETVEALRETYESIVLRNLDCTPPEIVPRIRQACLDADLPAFTSFDVAMTAAKATPVP